MNLTLHKFIYSINFKYRRYNNMNIFKWFRIWNFPLSADCSVSESCRRVQISLHVTKFLNPVFLHIVLKNLNTFCFIFEKIIKNSEQCYTL